MFYGWTGNSYLKLYSTERDSGKWSNIKMLDGNINTDYHNAAASFDAKESKLYFTRTNIEKHPNKVVGKTNINPNGPAIKKLKNCRPFFVNLLPHVLLRFYFRKSKKISSVRVSQIRSFGWKI